ncbi:MAG: hypothetical protein KAI25_00215 [Hyphomicrobiaceae bacterium]|nr:hypothetical protein [Hyphomicrobiaceae bacterium]
MIDDRDLHDLILKHDHFVREKQPQWDRHRAAYDTKFWKNDNDFSTLLKGTDNDLLEGGADLPIKVEENKILPYVQSFVANLFYKGARTQSTPDSVLDEGQELLNKDELAAVDKLNDRFLNSAEVQEQAEYAYQKGLMYGECAFKIGTDDPKGGGSPRPTDSIWVDVIPPWECFWDREETRPRHLRQIGHIYWLSEHEVRRNEQWKVPSDFKPTTRPDIVKEGQSDSRGKPERPEEKFFRVLELYDMTVIHSDNTAGELRIYLIETAPRTGPDSNPVKTKIIFKTKATGFTWSDGARLAPIVPLILENIPEHPLRAIIPVASLYEINAEQNMALTIRSNKYRRDAARILLYLKDRVEEAALNGITKGKDFSLVGVDNDTLEGLMRWLDPPPTSPTHNQYVNDLRSAEQGVQGTAQQTRGQQGAYLTATEAQILNDYSESTFGRYRKRMDDTLARLCAMHIRVLIKAMEVRKMETIRIQVAAEIVEIDTEALNRQWQISIIDTANTPIAEAQRRQEFIVIHSIFLELAAGAGGEDPRFLQEVSKKLVKIARQLWDFPPDMDPDAILAGLGPMPAVPGEAAPGAQGAQDPMTALQDPAVQAAIMESTTPPEGGA